MSDETMALRQLLYVSDMDPNAGPIDVARIIEQSRHNNAIDGVTGVLWSDGARFLQVLEGPSVSVAETFARIVRDPRHLDVRILQDAQVDEREFGSWSMEQRCAAEGATPLDTRMERLLQRASQPTRTAFSDWVERRS